MQKIIALLLCLSLLFVFAGCGDKSDKPKDDTLSKVDASNDPNPKGENIVLQYDDYYTFEKAKSVKTSDVSKIKVSGKEIHATAVTDEPVTITVEGSDGKITDYDVTVGKAKINIVVVAGQSNANGEVSGVPATADKYKSTTTTKGTAYLWGPSYASPQPMPGGGGANADGFRPALAEEWYRQSIKAGDREKTVVVYGYNYTATPGEKIDEWLGNGEMATLAKTAKMLNACYDYYESGKGAANFEIAGCGMYWFQGESDRQQSTAFYYSRINDVWSGLKSATSNRVKYLAFMRIRCSKTADSVLDYSGPVIAQFQYANDNADVFMASTVTENWSGKNRDTATADISKFSIFDEKQYKDIISGTIITETQVNIYGGLHYSRLGFNILGADAAYNMYHSLKSPENAVVLAQSDGNPGIVAKEGSTVNVAMADIKKDIMLRLHTASAGGTLSVKVVADGNDVTESVKSAAEQCLISRSKIKAFTSVTITATVNGKATTFKIA